jgi:hypothetical protein
MLKIIFLKNIILMHFRAKSTLNRNRYHTPEHPCNLIAGQCFADTQPNSDPQQIDRKDVQKDKQGKLRSHPLFFGITMGLLAEIINSR